MKNYIRLLTRLTDTPLFISQDKLSLITENVLVHLAAGTMHSTEFDNSVKLESRAAGKPSTTNSIAVVEVYDSLQAKGGGGLSGFTTYEGIRTNLQTAVDAGFTNIMLDIDSPGGEVTGLFALTSYMRNLRASGIHLTSYIDGMATSAAFAIAAATSARYITNTSFAGSIGAIMVHLETSKADATAGRTYTIFRSKSEKALGDSHTVLSEEVKNKFEVMLASMDTAFNNDIIASMPQLSLQSIIDMKGSEFIASDALRLGLVDAIVPEVDSAIKLALQNKPTASAVKLQSTQTQEVKMNEEELKIALASAQGESAKLKLDLSVLAAATVTAERERVVAIMEASKVLNIGMSTTIAHITKGYDAEASLEIQTAIAEGLGKSTQLSSANDSAALAPEDLADANKAAARVDGLRAGALASGFKLKKV